MANMYESRLDGAVPARLIGVGEDVIVKTKMGNDVFAGEVVAQGIFGLTIKESSGSNVKSFSDDLYIFSVKNPGENVYYANKLDELSVDERVRLKLRSEAIVSDDKKNDEPDDGDGGEKESDKDDKKNVSAKKGDSKKEKPKDDESNEDGKEVDVEKLPDDVKDAVTKDERMSGDKVDNVVGETGDAILKALRRADFDEEQVYDIVSGLQKKIRKELEQFVK